MSYGFHTGSSTWDQSLPVATFQAPLYVTPAASAILRNGTPRLAARRMETTCSSVSLDVPDLPFLAMSRMFSSCVPRNRCAGLMHAGVSQWWQMSSLPGSPTKHANERRCASHTRPRMLICPYPPDLDLEDFSQSQQPDIGSKCTRSRSLLRPKLSSDSTGPSRTTRRDLLRHSLHRKLRPRRSRFRFSKAPSSSVRPHTRHVRFATLSMSILSLRVDHGPGRFSAAGSSNYSINPEVRS